MGLSPASVAAITVTPYQKDTLIFAGGRNGRTVSDHGIWNDEETGHKLVRRSAAERIAIRFLRRPVQRIRSALDLRYPSSWPLWPKGR